ncbi:SIS domain protein [Ancylostoma duodenale]|uniref:SIS domain protein n=1 Tax=Ancylostoma duodenale TaxID=51022 RepID=A0A0C2CV36_9BILA|nr:SIS domain protein [Ancylostoma duodenale]
MALRYCKPRGALLIGVTNTVGSSICRESHCGIHINAGPEIGVASTKAYTSQILSLLMFALVLSDDRISMTNRRKEIISALNQLPDLIKEVLDLDQEALRIAHEIYKEKSLLIMGRGFNFATCLEGALKIKELSYMHCEGIMSGELKHGPLAMVDENLRICMVICNDSVYKKSLNALQQVVARGGAPIIIADRTVPEKDLAGMRHVLRVPKTVDCVQNILTVIPLQLMSYHIAELNGQNHGFFAVVPATMSVASCHILRKLSGFEGERKATMNLNRNHEPGSNAAILKPSILPGLAMFSASFAAKKHINALQMFLCCNP